MTPQEIKFLIELKELFDLFPIEVCENFLTDLKELEFLEHKQADKIYNISIVSMEYYLTLRKSA